MTRAKEIMKEADKVASANTQIIGDWGEHYLGFIHGAEWADAHPDIDVRTMAAWQSGYKEAIEKACEWPSSQKRKALFSTRKKAEEAVKRIDDNTNIEIVEL